MPCQKLVLSILLIKEAFITLKKTKEKEEEEAYILSSNAH